MQKVIKIFLASSEELKDDRKDFEIFINRQNKKLVSKDAFIELIIWEDLDEAVSHTRKQDEYNETIKESDILLVLIFSKAGKYTREEFEIGYQQFKETGKPSIYVYFKTPKVYPKGAKKEDAISAFEFEERLKELDHFPGEFSNIDNLLNKFGKELDEIIEKLLPVPPVQPGFPHLLTTIPKHDEEFIGRQEDLKKLSTELETSSKIVLMNGLGGIGKTTLAKKYVQANLDKYDHVAWVEVKTQDTGHEQNMTITEAFAYNEILTKSLKLEFTTESNEMRFNLIVQALSNIGGKNLLVIDNAREDLNKRDIKDILPRPPQWNILVTSRNNFSGFKTLEIETLPGKQAKELFRAYYTKPADEKDIEELLYEIGYHTLTIELLAKTLSYPGQKLVVKETLQKIRSRQLFSPDLQRKIESNHSEEETEVYIHLIQTFNLLPLTESEQWMMKQFCFLLPVSYPIDQLEIFLNIELEEKKKELHETLHSLNQKGWLQSNEEGYSIHRIVQQMADYQLQPSLQDTEQLITLITKLLFSDTHTNFVQLFYLIPYAEFILSKLNKKETEAALIGRLQTSLGIVVRRLGNYEKAKELHEAALNNYIKNFGEDHSEVATVRSNLSNVYGDLGEYEKARDLLEAALISDLKNFDEQHTNVAIDRSNLANIYRELGEYEKARDLLEAALVSDFKNFEEQHPSIAITQSNLALVYNDLGEYEKARDLLEKALEIGLKNFGEEHLSVANRFNNLAFVYMSLKDFKQAETYFEKAFHVLLKTVGPDHPNTKAVVKSLEYVKAK